MQKDWRFFKAKRLMSATCHTFYQNLENLYAQHKYPPNHIWNLDETNIQVGQQFGVQILVKQGS